MGVAVLLWVLTGAVTGLVAPGLLVTTGRWVGWDRLALPPAVAFPGFIVVHAVITISLVSDPKAPVWLALHAALLLGALVFWLPVLGQARRLGDAGRSIYLLVGFPPLDFAGIVVVALGEPAGGLAMIVGMLPMNLTALVVLWRWIVREDNEIGGRDQRPLAFDTLGNPVEG